MKKKYLLIGSIILIMLGVSFWQYTSYTANKKKAVVEEFKKYNETLVYDIFYYSPDIPNEEKRLSLKKRMDTKLVDSMCPPIPQISKPVTQPVNELIDMKTKAIKSISDRQRKVTTTFTIKTPEGTKFPQKVEAEYKEKDGKWVMEKIQPIAE
ncbi:hypothetical protein [Candidatus Enterococcus mansonii]|uniref:DUF4878 domain-containing protein n=1 Tax=Candidatus Enterococcus mansonii TaxID=1834181 RepID=A0A242CIF2_9ENTE|nr:hypothetical protein [Enterococcus sp. 4G2_DIV0659]OTO10017.1 hypothetical protein A5880_000700 [Enterococcus sp. 4G2_DIV0659]